MTPEPPSAGGDRWVGVGSSASQDAADAAREAAGAALAGRSARLLLVFATPRHDLGAIGAALRTQAPEAQVAGCTTAGEIAGTVAGSGNVVVVALGGDGLDVRTARASLADGARQAGATVAAAIEGISRPHRALLLITEGLTGDRSGVIRGAYAVVGAGVRLVGGAAGDDLAMRETHQLHGEDVLTGAVVGVAIGSDAPIGIGVGHGWRPLGEPHVVTESRGERVLSLDDEPALDVYARRTGADATVLDADELRRIGLHYPLGLTRPGGEDIRAALGADLDERSLMCGDVPQGTLISIMEGDAESVLAGTVDACDAALGMLEGHAPRGIIAFDCVARRTILGDEGLAREVELIAERAPGVPVGGFYTYGEIARTRGSRGVHNASLVVLAFA